MINYKTKFLSIMVFIMIALTSCSKLNNNLNPNENIDEGILIKNNPILSIADNESKYTDLITRKYSYEDLSECQRHGFSIEEIDLKCKIECLRKVNEQTYYAILKASNGGILIILFEEKGKYKLEVSDYWYMEELIYKDDFKSLKWSNTWKDVAKIDAFGTPPPFYVGNIEAPFVSSHQTIDGYIIRITYKRKNLKITRIQREKYTKLPWIIYANLLPMDIETIKEELGENE